jgi:hypothetical protein
MRADVFKTWERTPLGRLLPRLEEWLMMNFPTPYPVKLTYTAEKFKHDGEECDGLTDRKGKKLFIKIRNKKCRGCMVETMLHEWAHAHTWGHAAVDYLRPDEGHDDVYYLAYGKIRRKLFYQGGQEEVLKLCATTN